MLLWGLDETMCVKSGVDTGPGFNKSLFFNFGWHGVIFVKEVDCSTVKNIQDSNILILQIASVVFSTLMYSSSFYVCITNYPQNITVDSNHLWCSRILWVWTWAQKDSSLCSVVTEAAAGRLKGWGLRLSEGSSVHSHVQCWCWLSCGDLGSPDTGHSHVWGLDWPSLQHGDWIPTEVSGEIQEEAVSFWGPVVKVMSHYIQRIPEHVGWEMNIDVGIFGKIQPDTCVIFSPNTDYNLCGRYSPFSRSGNWSSARSKICPRSCLAWS